MKFAERNVWGNFLALPNALKHFPLSDKFRKINSSNSFSYFIPLCFLSGNKRYTFETSRQMLISIDTN